MEFFLCFYSYLVSQLTKTVLHGSFDYFNYSVNLIDKDWELSIILMTWLYMLTMTCLHGSFWHGRSGNTAGSWLSRWPPSFSGPGTWPPLGQWLASPPPPSVHGVSLPLTSWCVFPVMIKNCQYSLSTGTLFTATKISSWPAFLHPFRIITIH